jgi:O-antigen/teichoic acid export membrane protein
MSVARGVLLGTASSYLKVICRAVCGLITFRLLREGLGDTYFGFWVLLWSTFGFMILVDFGLGYTVQKAVARAAGDPGPESRRLVRAAVASVFWIGVALTAVVAVGVFVGGRQLLDYLFEQSGIADPATQAKLVGTAVMFAAGMLISYPFGLFREVLRGQQRMYVSDLVDVVGMIVQTGLVAWGCHTGWSLEGFMTAAVTTTVVPALAVTALAMRDPDVRPYPDRFSRRDLRELVSFSVYAYFNTLCGVVVYRCEPLIIGHVLSLQAVAWYAPIQKVAEMYSMLTQQMQGMLGPASAHVDARSADARARADGLRSLLLVSQRWATMVAASLVVPLVLDMTGALRALNGRASLAPGSEHVAWILVASVAIGVVGTSCARQVLLLTGHHRQILWFSVVEAAIKIPLAVSLLIAWKSIAGAAVGSLVPSLVLNVLVVPAYAHRVLEVRWRDAARACARGAAGSLSAIAAGVAWWAIHPLAAESWNFLAGCGVVAVAMLPGWWFLGMVPDERHRVTDVVRRLRRRR